MPVNWPAFLQQFLNSDSFTIKKGLTTIESSNEFGPPKIRRVSTRSVDVYTVSIFVHQSIANQFENFYNTTLNGGATPFYFQDPYRGVLSTFRITGEVSITPVGSAGTWNVAMTWYRLN